MDDGALWCVIISFALLILSAVFIGFLTAVTQTVAGEDPKEASEREEKGMDVFNERIRDRFGSTGIYFASLCLTIVACGVRFVCLRVLSVRSDPRARLYRGQDRFSLGICGVGQRVRRFDPDAHGPEGFRVLGP